MSDSDAAARSQIDLDAVASYLAALQDRICRAFEETDGDARFAEERVAEGTQNLARPRILEDGEVFEKAAVHFTRAAGDHLPRAATAHRPELAGRSFRACSLSLITHPRNPYVPISHANLRCFVAEHPEHEPLWWFGGGIDLTPCYGFHVDAIHWHRVAQAACTPFGADVYRRCKEACDRYFYLHHRGEARGIGGLFFDDLASGGFARCFAFARAVGDHYLEGYLPIVARRRTQPWGERERHFQLVRRGRYVEFNLLYDRGTRYGLESGRRIESVLASLPPLVRWPYAFRAEPGSPEARLVADFLRPRDWLQAAGVPDAGGGAGGSASGDAPC